MDFAIRLVNSVLNLPNKQMKFFTVFIRLTALSIYYIFGPWEWALIWGWALIKFSAFRMGAYSRWALIRGWALIWINVVRDSNYRRTVINPADQFFFFWLVEMTLVHANYSLPEWQAVKLTIAPCSVVFSYNKQTTIRNFSLTWFYSCSIGSDRV